MFRVSSDSHNNIWVLSGSPSIAALAALFQDVEGGEESSLEMLINAIFNGGINEYI